MYLGGLSRFNGDIDIVTNNLSILQIPKHNLSTRRSVSTIDPCSIVLTSHY